MERWSAARHRLGSPWCITLDESLAARRGLGSVVARRNPVCAGATLVFDLLAEGSERRQRCRFRLQNGFECVLGRDGDADIPIPWDRFISRRHVRLKVSPAGVEVERIHAASNPVFFGGNQVSECVVPAGQHFVIGETTFSVVLVPDAPSDRQDAPVEEKAFDAEELQRVLYPDPDRRIKVLSDLPKVIEGAASDAELCHHLVNLLLAGVPRAEAVGVVDLDAAGEARLLYSDRRRETAGSFRPSRRLVTDALLRTKRTTRHVWAGEDRSLREYTEAAEFDWAFCTPIPLPGAAPRGLYVAGKLDVPLVARLIGGNGAAVLEPDIKFTDFVAQIVSKVQQLGRLERERSALRQFFPQQVFAALGEDVNTEALKRRECNVTVMFCDLRGSSRKAEESADDLLGFSDRVEAALGVVTRFTLQYGGVTADFLGDAVLGFWGWPFPSDEAPVNACRAALGIRREFDQIHRDPEHPLANFAMGIGIAHGRAVAGKIGTRDQVKVTVFGPVVNLASRLESMTRELGVPIVLDEPTTAIVRPRLDPREGRLRRLAKVLPFGMDIPVHVTELLPPESEHPRLDDEAIARFERGVDNFIAGRWDEAYRELHFVPSDDDALDFLMARITASRRTAPPGWDGVIRLPNK